MGKKIAWKERKGKIMVIKKGSDYGRMGEENTPEKRDDHKDTRTETPTRVKIRLKESSVVGRQHVSEQAPSQRDGACNSHVGQGEAGQKVESFQSVDIFHENGKVSSPKAKVDGKLIKVGRIL